MGPITTQKEAYIWANYKDQAAEVTPNGALVRERFPQNALNSGLGTIVIYPDISASNHPFSGCKLAGFVSGSFDWDLGVQLPPKTAGVLLRKLRVM